MAPLAEAFVRLRSDPSMLAGDVRRDATRAGTAGGTVMGREFGTAFRRVSRTLIGLGIGTFAVEAGRFAVGMADKFELSRSRLETVTKNLGGNFSAISDQIQALDDRLAAFGFTNADVEGSVASLESATKSSTKALQDAALAADIARGRNISLESATQILMRVETGHVAMLSRLGIATKDANGHLLTQQEALTQLARLYGGAASHFAGTFAGKQQALRAELGNTASEIGVALLPAAVDLAHVLQHDILPPLESSAKFFDRNRKTIEPLVGMVIKLTLAYKGLKAAQKLFQAFNVGKVATSGATSALTSEAFSMAHPLPVFVVNSGPGGTKLPPVVSTGRKVATAAEDTATTGIEVGTGLAGRPIVGVGSLKLSHLSTSDNTALVQASALIAALPQAAQEQAKKQLGGVLSQQSSGSALHNFFLGPNLKTVVDTKKLADLEQQWQKLAPAAGKGTTAEKNAATAITHTTGTVKDQAKALADAQSKALDLASGQDSLRQAVHNMAVTAGQGGRALKGNSDAALANRDALRGAVQQAESYLTTLKQHSASASHVADVELNLARAIKTSATNTYGNSTAVKDLLKQLGFLPGQIQAVADALGSTPPAFNKWMGSERRGLGDFVTTHTKGKAKDAGKALADSLLTGYTPIVTSGVGNATSHAVDTAFSTAKSKMQSDLSSIKQFFASQKATFLSAFGTLSTTPGTDSLGGSFGAPTGVKAQLRADAAQMHTFARLWHRLDDMHLDPRLLAQFAGPDYIPAMQELVRGGRAEIRQVDRLEGRIARDAAGITRESTADKYNRLIHDDLIHLPPKLIKPFEQALRNAGFGKNVDPDKRQGRRVSGMLG